MSEQGQPSNGVQEARNTALLERLEKVSVEAAIDDAVRRNATNAGRVNYDASDIALRQALMAIITANPLDPLSHSEKLFRLADLYNSPAGGQ